MLIRKAYPADIPLIREMAFNIWPTTYANILTPEQLHYMLDRLYNGEILHKQMEENIEFILAYDGVDPVGFASFGRVEPEIYKLHKLYVLPSTQGRGIGRFIIEHIEKEMITKGATTLHLNVNRFNNAIIFYEKLGFRTIREEDVDIGNGFFMNDFVMEKKLQADS